MQPLRDLSVEYLMPRFGAAALFVLYSAVSLVAVISGFASAQPEKAAAIPWFIWLGALGGILLASAGLARWLTPRGARKYWTLYSLAAFLFAWLPCAGLFVLLSEKIDLAREESAFRRSCAKSGSSILTGRSSIWVRQVSTRRRASARHGRGPGSSLSGTGSAVIPWPSGEARSAGSNGMPERSQTSPRWS